MLVPLYGLRLAILGGLIIGCSGPSAEDRFARDVVPILEGHCLGGACHGVIPDAEARGEVVDSRS